MLVPVAKANVLEDYVERSQRPTMTNEQAVVKLLDARGILYELKVESASLCVSDAEPFSIQVMYPTEVLPSRSFHSRTHANGAAQISCLDTGFGKD